MSLLEFECLGLIGFVLSLIFVCLILLGSTGSQIC